MVRRVSIQTMLLFCIFIAWSLVLVDPCIAQESANLGIFDATADWGSFPGYGQKSEHYNIPSRVEISEDDENPVYDVYGNGYALKNDIKEFLVYKEKSGSYSMQGSVQIINNDGLNISSDAGFMFFETKEDKKECFYGMAICSYKDIQRTYIVSFWKTKNDVFKMKYIYQFSEPFKKIYLRISRYDDFDRCHSEWSLDGISWRHVHSKSIKMSDTLNYSMIVGTSTDDNVLTHARFTDVAFNQSSQFIRRYIAPKGSSSECTVFLDVMNPNDEIQESLVIERPPEYCSIENISHNGSIKDGTISWNIPFPKGITTLRYTAQPISSKVIHNRTFSGYINSKPTIGDRSLVQYTIFMDTIYWMLFMGVPVVLLIIHFFIYLFYPKSTEYLYFSLFLLVVSIGHYATFLPSSVNLGFNNSIGTLQWSFIVLFFHKIVFNRLTLYSWIIAILVLIAIQFYPLSSDYHIWPHLFWIEVLRIIFFAYRKNIEGKVFFTIGLFVWFWISFGMYLFSFASFYVPNIGGFANLSFLIFMTLYLTYRFAKTQKRYATLNVELEDRVDRRTKELEHANEELDTTNQYLNNANSELQEANAQLIQLDQMKTQFVSQASHDLRTPLTAIKGSLDNLLMGIAGALNEKQQKVMTRATTSVDRLTNLINDVLDLNRIETGRIVLEKSDIPFKTLVDNIVNENRPAADQKQITLNANLGDEITLHIDGSKIERVVGELISNAIKYTPDNGTVDVSLMTDEQNVSLTVKDSGIGMTPEECGKIWERFYRTAASQKFAKGSGLGLSIAKELVELHGGTIEIISEQSKGTTFTLRLPRDH